jgi:hypothetical protein
VVRGAVLVRGRRGAHQVPVVDNQHAALC